MNSEKTQKICIAAMPTTLASRFPEVTGNSVVVTRRLVESQTLSSATQRTFRTEFWTARREVLTNDLPIDYSTTRNLDRRGIVKIGSIVRTDDVLVGKAVQKHNRANNGEDGVLNQLVEAVVPSERLVNDSLTYAFQELGVVLNTSLVAKTLATCESCGDFAPLILTTAHKSNVCPYCKQTTLRMRNCDVPFDADAQAQVTVSIWRDLQPGDVLKDENGNTITVAKIIELGEMPRRRGSKRPIDLLFHCDSKLASTLSTKEVLQHSELKGTKSDSRRMFVGNVRVIKETMVQEDVVIARGTGNYGFRSLQPLTSRWSNSAQRLTAETVSALYQQGYRVCLEEILSIKSDDVQGRRQLVNSVVNNSALRTYAMESVRCLEFQLRAAGIDVEFRSSHDGSEMRMVFASSKRIESWSHGEITNKDFYDDRTYRPIKGGLFCERIFGPEKDWKCSCGKYNGKKYKDMICDRCNVKIAHSEIRRTRMAHIALATPLIHPWALYYGETFAKALKVTREQLHAIAHYKLFALFDEAGQPKLINELPAQSPVLQGADAIRALMRFNDAEYLRELVIEDLPVMPAGLREPILNRYNKLEFPEINLWYCRLVARNERLKKLNQLKAPEIILCNERRMLQDALEILFCNSKRSDPLSSSSNEPYPCHADGLLNSQTGLFTKTVDFAACGVAIPNGDVSTGQIGMPEAVIERLFAPWIIQLLIDWEFANTIENATLLLQNGLPKALREELLDAAMGNRPVLAINEDHLAHPMRPVRVSGKLMCVNPDDSAKLRMNFQGEKITIHVPISEAAVAELSSERKPEAGQKFISDLGIEKMFELALTNKSHELSSIDQIVLGQSGKIRGSLPCHANAIAINKRSLSFLGISESLEKSLSNASICKIGDLLNLSSNALRSHVTPEDYELIIDRLTGFGISATFSSDPSGDRDMDNAATAQNIETPLGVLKMSHRSQKILTRNGIETVSALISKTPEELLQLQSFGVVCLDEVRKVLFEFDRLQLREDETFRLTKNNVHGFEQ